MAMEYRLYMAFVPLLWMILFLIVPLTIIFKIGFSEPTFSRPPFSEIFSQTIDYVINIRFSLKNYITILCDSYYLSAFLNSIYLGFLTTVFCLIIGFPMAYGIHSIKSRKTKLLLLTTISLSFWTPLLIRIYSWISLLGFHGFINSMLLKFGIIKEPIQFLGNYYIVCLGMIFCYLPFMIFPVYAVLEKTDQSYIEAANDLGCRPIKSFWSITVPLSISGTITGCIVVFAASFGEYVIPELLGDTSTIMFGKVLWTEFFTNLDWPMACSLSTVMVLLIVIPIIIFQKKRKSNEILKY
jgi:putrescine transport system permease protein